MKEARTIADQHQLLGHARPRADRGGTCEGARDRERARSESMGLNDQADWLTVPSSRSLSDEVSASGSASRPSASTPTRPW